MGPRPKGEALRKFTWGFSFKVCVDCILVHPILKALRKKQLVAEGKLGKFGKILETTPAEIKNEYEL